LAAARPPSCGEGADFPVLHPPRVGQSPRGFPGATLPAAPTPGTGRAREVGQTSLWRRTALRPLSAPAPPPAPRPRGAPRSKRLQLGQPYHPPLPVKKAFFNPRPLTRPRPRGTLALTEVSMSTLARLEKRLQEKTQPQLTERLTIRLDKPTYEALESLAEEYSLSIAELAREALVMLADEYRTKRPEKKSTQSLTQPSLPPQE